MSKWEKAKDVYELSILFSSSNHDVIIGMENEKDETNSPIEQVEIPETTDLSQTEKTSVYKQPCYSTESPHKTRALVFILPLLLET